MKRSALVGVLLAALALANGVVLVRATRVVSVEASPVQTSKGRASTPSSDAPALPVDAVDSIGMTVSDMDRAVEFYTKLLTFRKVSDVEVAGRAHELLQGVFGARMRVVRLRLGGDTIELTEYLTPRGRPIPDDLRPNDHAFQHVAVIVRDMDEAYTRLRQAGVMHASTGPQLLPQWNRNAAGISAFYFRDPDRHFLEVLHFPADKGQEKWHRTDRVFLGIDHTAIVVSDTDASLGLYRDLLGMSVAGESENYDTEQEHLNNVFGARLRITALRAAQGPGIEFLEYLAPGDGRPAPIDLRANDLAHWQVTLRTATLEPLLPAQRLRRFRLVSPGAVDLPPADPLGITSAALVRDGDGHGIRLTVSDADGR